MGASLALMAWIEWTDACYSLIPTLNGSEQGENNVFVMDTNDNVETK